MISEFAIGEIEQMQRDGLSPTPRDIVRLNALGLKLDHSNADVPLYQSRRTATVADVTLQEPTIGHQLFLAALAAAGFDDTDPTTFIVLRAWALSMDQEILPKSWTIPGVRQLVGEFMEAHFLRVTVTQLTMAVNYVLFGYDSATLERPVTTAAESAAEHTADDTAVDDSWNFALGVIHEGERIGLGISLADARQHTLAEMNAIIELAIEDRLRMRNAEATKSAIRNKYVSEFYATALDIRERLEKERNSNG